MNLTLATLLAGALATAMGGSLLAYPEPFRKYLTAFPRSRAATLVLLSIATGLVLFHVSQLGEADFGKYKNILLGFFLILAIGSWFKVPDFLGIRALSVLGLLLAGQFLNSAYLEPPTTRLFLVVFSYLLILASLYLAAVPYRFRDAVFHLDQSSLIRRVTGAFLLIYGLILLFIPLAYSSS